MTEIRRVTGIREMDASFERFLGVAERERTWEIKGLRINAPVPEWPYPSVEETHAYYIMPVWTLQARAIEYRMDVDTEFDLLLDMVMHEPYIPDYDDPELWFALTREDAREIHLKRALEAKSTTVRWDFDSVLGRRVRDILWEHRKGYDEKLAYLDTYVDEIRKRPGGGDSARRSRYRNSPIAGSIVAGGEGHRDPVSPADHR